MLKENRVPLDQDLEDVQDRRENWGFWDLQGQWESRDPLEAWALQEDVAPVAPKGRVAPQDAGVLRVLRV